MPRRFKTLLLALAAGVAVPAAAQVEGSYQLVSINGQALPAPSPTEDGVTVLRASLLFQPDGHFVMQARSDDGDAQFGEDGDGVYRVRGDSLLLLEDGDAEEETVRFRWTMDRGTLHLFDEHGHDYAFTPAPAPTAAELHGRYRLVRINGHPLPYQSDDDVTVQVLDMVLQPDGRYTLHLETREAGEKTKLDVRGTYRVGAGTLVLEPDPDEEYMEVTEMTWTFRDGVLLLVDEIDDEYAFARR